MADIFISYSSKDRAQAEQLTELLASAGLSVWIDQHGIEAATQWSKEIVDAINDCKALVLLISSDSIVSQNVIKEVLLASEKRKKIVPLDLEPVLIPPELEYQLAGIQRTPMTNIDSIIRALGRIGLEATQAPTLTLIKEVDSRKSLMILPFEDLSPTGDNQWFADGIVSEMISLLSNVKVLRLTDAQTTREFRQYKGSLAKYAKEMQVRYFVQGEVRKFGDQIKITSRLLDIETSDHLWQDSMKGTMQDIFEIQEQVAQQVLRGLNVHLTQSEREELSAYSTNNPEAYELYLKGKEYGARHTRSDYERGLSLFAEACKIDPNFVNAQAAYASLLVEMYRAYDRNPHHLDEAEKVINRMKEITGPIAPYAWTMSKISLRRNDPDAALRYAQQCIQLDPNYAPGFTALAFAYEALRNGEEEIQARKEEIRLRGNMLSARFNLLVALDHWGMRAELQEEAKQAIPLFEKFVRLHPDDYNTSVQLACVMFMADRVEDALHKAEELSKVEALDGIAHVNLTSIYINVKRSDLALKELASAIKKGFRGFETFSNDPDFAALFAEPKIAALIKDAEKFQENNG